MLEFANKAHNKKQTNQYSAKIQHIKEKISFSNSVIAFNKKQIQIDSEELDDLAVKEKNLRAELEQSNKKIDTRDLKPLRTEYKLKSILKYGKRAEEKLDKVKIRLKNVVGDAFLLAVSVAYVGALSLPERVEFRKSLAEKLLNSANIEASEYWLSDNDQTHCKLFKKIICNDLGMKELFNCLPHLFLDTLYAEFLVEYLYSPTTPIIYDPVGCFKDNITSVLCPEINGKSRVLFSSDYMLEEKLKHSLALPSHSAPLILLSDVTDFSKLNHGKS